MALSAVSITELLWWMIFFISLLRGVIFFIPPDYIMVMQQSSINELATFIFSLFNALVFIVLLPQLINTTMILKNGFYFDKKREVYFFCLWPCCITQYISLRQNINQYAQNHFRIPKSAGQNWPPICKNHRGIPKLAQKFLPQGKKSQCGYAQ